MDHDEQSEAPDSTLGGYFEVHDRPPAFEASDGQPYTVSIEVEQAADLRNPFIGYLVFPRWAGTGLGVVGHVETPILFKGATRDEVSEQAGALPLEEVKALLDEAVQQRDRRE